jgi:hypothetical protein
MIINRIYGTQNLLSLEFVSFLVGLRTYQHPCIYLNILYLKKEVLEVNLTEQVKAAAMLRVGIPEIQGLYSLSQAK